ncbi:MAG: hypothetical protein AAF225_09765 [Pseudomonadota bacterium]
MTTAHTRANDKKAGAEATGLDRERKTVTAQKKNKNKKKKRRKKPKRNEAQKKARRESKEKGGCVACFLSALAAAVGADTQRSRIFLQVQVGRCYEGHVFAVNRHPSRKKDG